MHVIADPPRACLMLYMHVTAQKITYHYLVYYCQQIRRIVTETKKNISPTLGADCISVWQLWRLALYDHLIMLRKCIRAAKLLHNVNGVKKLIHSRLFQTYNHNHNM